MPKSTVDECIFLDISIELSYCLNNWEIALDKKEIVMSWTRTMQEILWYVAIFILRDVKRPKPVFAKVKGFRL